MTYHSHEDDSRLRDALRDAAPSARFDAETLRARIEESVARGPERAGRSHRRPRYRLLLFWSARAAAAVALLIIGAWYGRRSAESESMRLIPAYQAMTAQPDLFRPVNVPLSIQSAGTGYVASLALLSEMRDQLTPEQHEQARQVALAVLIGAIAELAAGENGALPNGVLAAVLGHGVSTGGIDDAVVRYR
jgi:hypothetical protein